MSLKRQATRLPGTLTGVSLLCPVSLAVIVGLMKLGLIRFHDDFTGFKGIVFFLGWGVALLSLGTLTGVAAWFIDRASWPARLGAGLNVLLLAWILLLLARFAR